MLVRHTVLRPNYRVGLDGKHCLSVVTEGWMIELAITHDYSRKVFDADLSVYIDGEEFTIITDDEYETLVAWMQEEGCQDEVNDHIFSHSMALTTFGCSFIPIRDRLLASWNALKLIVNPSISR